MPTLCLTSVQSPTGSGRGPRAATNVITFWNDIPYEAAKGLLPQFTTPPKARISEGQLIANWPLFDRSWIGRIVCFDDVCVVIEDYVSETILEVDAPDHVEDDFTDFAGSPVDATTVMYSKQRGQGSAPSLMGLATFASSSPPKRFLRKDFSGLFRYRATYDDPLDPGGPGGDPIAIWSDLLGGHILYTGPSTVEVNSTFERVINQNFDLSSYDFLVEDEVTLGQNISPFTIPAGLIAPGFSATPAQPISRTSVNASETKKTFFGEIGNQLRGYSSTNPAIVLQDATAEENLSLEDTETDAITRYLAGVDGDWTTDWVERFLETDPQFEDWYQNWLAYSVYCERQGASSTVQFSYSESQRRYEISGLGTNRSYLLRVNLMKRPFFKTSGTEEVGAWAEVDPIYLLITSNGLGEAVKEFTMPIEKGFQYKDVEPQIFR